MTTPKTKKKGNPKKSDADTPTAKAARFAALKRRAAPLLAQIEQLGGELKDFFRSHPDVNQLGDVGFSVSQRPQLDTKALRAELGDKIAKFEKVIPIETLSLLRKSSAA